jgi:hypothetical protein
MLMIAIAENIPSNLPSRPPQAAIDFNYTKLTIDLTSHTSSQSSRNTKEITYTTSTYKN